MEQRTTVMRPVCRQRIGKHTPTIIKWLLDKRCFLFSPCKVVIRKTTEGYPVIWELKVLLWRKELVARVRLWKENVMCTAVIVRLLYRTMDIVQKYNNFIFCSWSNAWRSYSYSGGLRFKSRQPDRLSWLRCFLAFLSLSRQFPA
jgi:hypothetical protein